MKDALIEQALARIALCEVPSKLKTMIKNAQRHAQPEVVRAAQLRLYAVSPAAESGTLEHDVWQSIYALEDALAQERGKTIRLSRTRQMIARKDEQQTVAALVSKKTASDGFGMLVDRDMLDLTFESVALRHADRFDQNTLEMCRNRLASIENHGDDASAE
ncbi:MAG: hypothetical protein KIT23_06905 [Sphingopyxis sp.]|nr:hypothetical protein [Sphingopyxis sp.]